MNYAIIVAGGKGIRMGNDIPKQFMLLCNKPILMHTIERFRAFDAQIKIVVVLPKEQQQYWSNLCSDYHFDIEHTVVDGGSTRFDSSLNGLKAIDGGANDYVAIHDGVRPLVSKDTIQRCFDAVLGCKAVIPVVKVVDSLRKTYKDGREKNVDRSAYSIVQTPQTFSVELLKKAYEQPYNPLFTDDASVVEHLGERVFSVEGNRENIKITTPFDIIVASAVLNNEL